MMSVGGRKRIGVFVCHCGVNIAGVVDVEGVAKKLASYPDVAFATDYIYMCSEPGQAKVIEIAEENNLNAIIVAACSPTLHEMTFRNAARRVGINAYHVEIANIREQCSWVHSDKERATRKSLDIIKTMIEKLRLDQELNPIKCPVNRKALVIGAGISGMQAALDIANRGYRVILVERESYIGGHMASLSKISLTLNESTEVLSKTVMDVYHHKYIELFTLSEVMDLKGYVGNFVATIRKKPSYVRWDKCDGCGVCVDVCPVSVPFESQSPYTKTHAIYLPPIHEIPKTAAIDRAICKHFTKGCDACQKACPREAITFKQKETKLEREIGAIVVASGFDLYPKKKIGEYSAGHCEDVIDGLQFERLLRESENNGNDLRRPSDGRVPKRVVFVSCTRSRDPEYGMPYCSNICCKYILKQARLYKRLVPKGQAYVFYIDVRTAGKNFDEVYQDAVEDCQMFYLRGKVSKIFKEGEDLVVWGVDTLIGKKLDITCDLVVLATAVVPSVGAKDLAKTLKIATDAHGFFAEVHPKLRPVESPTAGIFLAGCARGPLDIPESITYASGAASKVMALFSQDVISHEPIVAYVDNELCAGCGICVAACPFDARILNERTRTAEIIEVLCQGCGGCVAACPNGACQQCNFDANQYMHMIDAVL
jgi:heterodisulfide reductase subunit A